MKINLMKKQQKIKIFLIMKKIMIKLNKKLEMNEKKLQLKNSNLLKKIISKIEIKNIEILKNKQKFEIVKYFKEFGKKIRTFLQKIIKIK